MSNPPPDLLFGGRQPRRSPPAAAVTPVKRRRRDDLAAPATPHYTSPTLPLGRAVWLPDEREVWRAAVLHDETTVQLVDAPPSAAAAWRVPDGRALPRRDADTDHATVGDLGGLQSLHEASVLAVLRARHARSTPYTRAADCIHCCVNPYRWLPLYTPEAMRSYFLGGYGAGSAAASRSTLAPHVYEASAGALRAVLAGHGDQSLVVTGESGAGKTETVKILVAHLAHIAGCGRPGASAGLEGSHYNSELHLLADPLLEAFGNAPSRVNENSSRFGKYLELVLDRECRLSGGFYRTYLLEKTRVVRQSLGEKNFHIFGLLVGDVETAKRFLPGGRKFRYITPAAGGTAQNAVAPAPLGHSATPQHRFSDVCESLGKLGLAPAALDALWSTVAGVLLLGEVMFYDYFAGGEERAAVLADGSLERAAEALAVEPTALASALTRRTLRAGHDDRCTVALSASRAAAARDALAKDVYSTVFEHVVATVNRALSPAAAETEAKAKTKTKTTSGTGIALLDIFGFEAAVEGVNGFEQLCINYANERLQQQFVGDVFAHAQLEYEREGISWSHVEFTSNAAPVALFEGSLGIVNLLNEECVRPAGSDAAFVHKLNGRHARSGTGCFVEVPRDPLAFMIRHYALPVYYRVDGWVEQNRDALPSDVAETLAASGHAFLAQAFSERALAVALAPPPSPVPSPRRGGAAAAWPSPRRAVSLNASTVITKFKSSLDTLMARVAATNVRYVRCIRPNSDRSPDKFDAPSVAAQLSAAGVVEAMRFSRSAYPNKMRHNDVLRRFSVLAAAPPSPQTSPGRAAKALLEVLLPEDGSETRFACGRTLCYFRAAALEELESRRESVCVAAAGQLQRLMRGTAARLGLSRAVLGATRLAARYRGRRSRGAAHAAHAAARRLQAWSRSSSSRERRGAIRTIAAFAQRRWRAGRGRAVAAKAGHARDARRALVAVLEACESPERDDGHPCASNDAALMLSAAESIARVAQRAARADAHAETLREALSAEAAAKDQALGAVAEAESVRRALREERDKSTRQQQSIDDLHAELKTSAERAASLLSAQADETAELSKALDARQRGLDAATAETAALGAAAAEAAAEKEKDAAAYRATEGELREEVMTLANAALRDQEAWRADVDALRRENRSLSEALDAATATGREERQAVEATSARWTRELEAASAALLAAKAESADLAKSRDDVAKRCAVASGELAETAAVLAAQKQSRIADADAAAAALAAQREVAAQRAAAAEAAVSESRAETAAARRDRDAAVQASAEARMAAEAATAARNAASAEAQEARRVATQAKEEAAAECALQRDIATAAGKREAEMSASLSMAVATREREIASREEAEHNVTRLERAVADARRAGATSDAARDAAVDDLAAAKAEVRKLRAAVETSNRAAWAASGAAEEERARERAAAVSKARSLEADVAAANARAWESGERAAKASAEAKRASEARAAAVEAGEQAEVDHRRKAAAGRAQLHAARADAESASESHRAGAADLLEAVAAAEARAEAAERAAEDLDSSSKRAAAAHARSMNKLWGSYSMLLEEQRDFDERSVALGQLLMNDEDRGAPVSPRRRAAGPAVVATTPSTARTAAARPITPVAVAACVLGSYVKGEIGDEATYFLRISDDNVLEMTYDEHRGGAAPVWAMDLAEVTRMAEPEPGVLLLLSAGGARRIVRAQNAAERAVWARALTSLVPADTDLELAREHAWMASEREAEAGAGHDVRAELMRIVVSPEADETSSITGNPHDHRNHHRHSAGDFLADGASTIASDDAAFLLAGDGRGLDAYLE